MEENLKEVKTLGGRTTFLFKELEDGSLILRIGKKRTRYIVNPGQIIIIRERILELDEKDRYVTSQYTDPKWKGCVGRMFAPAVAKLILDALIENITL
jgi:hypothetical protein